MIKTAQQKETWPEMGGAVEKNRRKSRKSRLAPILADLSLQSGAITFDRLL